MLNYLMACTLSAYESFGKQKTSAMDDVIYLTALERKKQPKNCRGYKDRKDK